LLVATAAVAGLSAVANAVKNPSTPAEVESAKFNLFKSQYQSNGGAGGINEMKAAYNALGPNDQRDLSQAVTGT